MSITQEIKIHNQVKYFGRANMAEISNENEIKDT